MLLVCLLCSVVPFPFPHQASPDALAIAQCALFLNDAKKVASVLDGLLQQGTVDAALLAYQVAFDLSENQNQPFLLRIERDLPHAPVAAAASASASSAAASSADGASVPATIAETLSSEARAVEAAAAAAAAGTVPE
jgi:hypothetical protein